MVYMNGNEAQYLARTIPQLAHLLLISAKLSIELLHLDFDGLYACICLLFTL